MSIGMFTAAAPALSRIFRTIIFRNNVPGFPRNYIILLPALIWLLTLVGGLWSDNITYWLWDVRVKLPIALLPLFAWLFQDVIKRNFLLLSGLFISAVTAACIVCLWVAVNHAFSGRDLRNASIFISHIRFGLMMAFVIPLLYFVPGIPVAKNGLRGSLFFLLTILFLSFEILTANLTGIILMVVVLFFVAIHFALEKKKMIPKFFVGFILLTLLSIILWVRSEYNSYFTIRSQELQPMEATSALGEMYLKCEMPYIVEEGRITGRYIALDELDSAWRSRTQIHLNSKDGRGQPLKFTLIRYLTSKDSRKDAGGVASLSSEDVQFILDGNTSVNESHRPAIINRLYALFYEWSVYKETGLVSGHSVFQRVEFWKVACKIIHRNMSWGVGPGDVSSAFEETYNEMNSSLEKAHRLRAHNQFMTFWISFGVAGCLLLLCILIWPVYQMKWGLLSCFVLIVFLSCLTEDTLETQAGVCFYAFFSSVLMAAHPRGIDKLHSR